jgi:hypothetical protein
MVAMGTKSREVIWGGAIMGARIHAKHAREEAQKPLAKLTARKRTRGLCRWKAMAVVMLGLVAKHFLRLGSISTCARFRQNRASLRPVRHGACQTTENTLAGSRPTSDEWPERPELPFRVSYALRLACTLLFEVASRAPR